MFEVGVIGVRDVRVEPALDEPERDRLVPGQDGERRHRPPLDPGPLAGRVPGPAHDPEVLLGVARDLSRKTSSTTSQGMPATRQKAPIRPEFRVMGAAFSLPDDPVEVDADPLRVLHGIGVEDDHPALPGAGPVLVHGLLVQGEDHVDPVPVGPDRVVRGPDDREVVPAPDQGRVVVVHVDVAAEPGHQVAEDRTRLVDPLAGPTADQYRELLHGHASTLWRSGALKNLPSRGRALLALERLEQAEDVPLGVGAVRSAPGRGRSFSPSAPRRRPG